MFTFFVDEYLILYTCVLCGGRSHYERLLRNIVLSAARPHAKKAEQFRSVADVVPDSCAIVSIPESTADKQILCCINAELYTREKHGEYFINEINTKASIKEFLCF